MDLTWSYEVSRLSFRCERLAPESELLRWYCEQRKIGYREESILAPEDEDVLPSMVTHNGMVRGLESVLDRLDRRCRESEQIFGDLQTGNVTRQLLANLQSKLARPVAQLWHYLALADPSFSDWLTSSRSAPGRIATESRGSPKVKERLSRRYHLDRFDAATTLAQIKSTLTQIETDLEATGGQYFHGDEPTGADVIFAAFLSPLVCPQNSSAAYPELPNWPAPLRELVEKVRQRRAGQLALAVYQHARPPHQPTLPPPSYGPTFMEGLFGPRVIRRGGQILLRLAPRLQIGNRLIVSTWDDVTTVLIRDNDFLIAPVNEARINSVGGPFMLGMDRSPALMHQREHVYSALRDAKKEEMARLLEQESKRLLDDAIAQGGKVDVVNGYARLVAGRTAAQLFGIRGPTEQDLLRVIRSIFHETFLNQSGDLKVRERGIAASLEIRSWIEEEIANRVAQRVHGDDVLGKLLDSCGADLVGARLMLGGCLVGAIDTTATAVTNIIAEVVTDGHLKKQMRLDLDDPRRFEGWCWEALRRRPHNAGMLRQAGQLAALPGKPVKEGTQVILLTVAAMHDPAAFDRPNELIPDRPLDRYLHFGYGLHQCAGRNFNAFQIPYLVRELVRRDVSGSAKVRTQGPFPDELIVSLQAPG
jgi:cytochrome P450/glutathione S-transferase